MSFFPYEPRAQRYSERRPWQAIVVPGVQGVQQVREQLLAPLFAAKMHFKLETPAAQAALDDFLATIRGGAVVFGFHSHDVLRLRNNQAVGTGDGTTAAFELPFGEVAGYMVNVAGVTKTEHTEYQVGIANRLAYSEVLSDATFWAAQGGAAVTRTPGQANPTGVTGPANTAWRIQTAGGASTAKLAQAIGTPTAGYTSLVSLYVKNQGAKALTITDSLGGTQTLASGASSFTLVTLTTVAGGGGSSLAFSAPAAGDALDFVIWHPWCAWTDANFGTPAVTWGYLPTIGAAIAASTNRNMRLAFYTAPAAAAAVKITAQGRLWVPYCCLVGEVPDVSPTDYGIWECDVEVATWAQ